MRKRRALGRGDNAEGYERNVLGSATNARTTRRAPASYSKAQETGSELARRNLMQSRGQGASRSWPALPQGSETPTATPLFHFTTTANAPKARASRFTRHKLNVPHLLRQQLWVAFLESFCSTPRIKIAQAYRSCETASPATRSPVSSLNLMACKSLVGQRGPRQLGGTDLLPADDPGDVLRGDLGGRGRATIPLQVSVSAVGQV